MKPLTIASILCVISLLFPRPSEAQSAAAVAEAARSDYRKAEAEVKAGNLRRAEQMLIDLYARSPTFDVAALLAGVEARLGEHARAARHYAAALASVPPREKAETSARIQAALSAELVQVGTVRVSANRKPADIWVDGEAMGNTAQTTEVYVKPGKRTVEVRSGSAVAKRDIEIAAGTIVPVSFELATDTEPTRVEPASSPHGPATMPPRSPPSRDTEDRPQWLPVGVAAGVALVAVGVGTGFAIDASNAKADGNKKRAEVAQAAGHDSGCTMPTAALVQPCRELHDLQDRRESSKTIATVSFVVGGLSAAATAGLFFLWREPMTEHGQSARIGAWVDGKSGSITLEGSF